MRFISLTKNLLLATAISAVFSSCSSKANLYVRSYSFDRKSLASYIIDTPDPAKLKPDYGQRLNIEWSIPDKEFQIGATQLVINIKLKNSSYVQEIIPLHKKSGRYLYTLSSKDYTKSGGIASYNVELLVNDHVITSSKHKLWANKLVIGEE